MKTYVYCIFDKVANEGGPLFQAKNDAVALRQFQMMREGLHKEVRPDDFKLFRLGFYDSDTLSLHGQPEVEIFLQTEGEE